MKGQCRVFRALSPTSPPWDAGFIGIMRQPRNRPPPSKCSQTIIRTLGCVICYPIQLRCFGAAFGPMTWRNQHNKRNKNPD
eukprot:5667818-Amphidinium_carterae.1